ncbi:MAG: hypothetical protein ACLTZB_00235 [Streptococcus salivarius]
MPKPTLPPTDYRMYSDPRFVDDNGTYYYRVAMMIKCAWYRWLLQMG